MILSGNGISAEECLFNYKEAALQALFEWKTSTMEEKVKENEIGPQFVTDMCEL